MSDAVAAAAANIDGMLAEAEEMGLDAAVANVLPWNNGHPAADEPIDAAQRGDRRDREAPRRSAARLPRRTRGPKDEPGTMAPEYTDDGDHPSIEGYRVLGELVGRKRARALGDQLLRLALLGRDGARPFLAAVHPGRP